MKGDVVVMVRKNTREERVLTLRELNRTTLARQLLLNRTALPALDVIRHLVGLQAQTSNAPYIGLWTRLQDFQRDELTHLMEQRQVVRATLMRSTLHLMTAEDYLQFRSVLQPALTRALNAFFGQRAKGLDIESIVTIARAYVEEQPRSFPDIRTHLTLRDPEREPELLAYAIRTHLPLVQIPPGGTWGFAGSPLHITAESWLRRQLCTSEGPQALILRYLAAFGPASVQDMQTWSGLGRLQSAVDELKPQLRSFQDEQGKVLFDLPDLPILPGDTPAPVRFLPEFDNVILSHADRRRVIADKHRSSVFLSAGRVRATFLVDGFVAGTWKITRERDVATLIIESFEPLSHEHRNALNEEGERLVRFVEDKAESFVVQFVEREL